MAMRIRTLFNQTVFSSVFCSCFPAVHRSMCPHSNSAAQRATFPCCGSILTATPLFLENGFTDLSALHVTGQYRHVFDLEVLETTDTETIYELPRSYTCSTM